MRNGCVCANCTLYELSGGASERVGSVSREEPESWWLADSSRPVWSPEEVEVSRGEKERIEYLRGRDCECGNKRVAEFVLELDLNLQLLAYNQAAVSLLFTIHCSLTTHCEALVGEECLLLLLPQRRSTRIVKIAHSSRI